MDLESRIKVTRDEVLAFRSVQHHLAERLPKAALLEAAGACGLQNTPPGSAALALQARLTDFTLDYFNNALEVQKTLIQTWSLRGAPYIFPTQDISIYTSALLPEDEESLIFFIRGIEPALNTLKMSLSQLLALSAASLLEVLDGQILANKQQLDRHLARHLAERLDVSQLAAWQSPSWYGANQMLGEAIVSFILRLLALQKLICFAPRHGNEASFVRTDQWLGKALPEVDSQIVKAELVRHYLHCYGPSTVKQFAAWAGVRPIQAQNLWGLVESELVEVVFEGKPVYLLERDLLLLKAARELNSIRLLPPHDPYLQLTDRETVLADRTKHRQIWLYSGNPGVVFRDGKIIGIWRPQKKGKTLLLKINRFEPFSEDVSKAITQEAEFVAQLKECSSVSLQF